MGCRTQRGLRELSGVTCGNHFANTLWCWRGSWLYHSSARTRGPHETFLSSMSTTINARETKNLSSLPSLPDPIPRVIFLLSGSTNPGKAVALLLSLGVATGSVSDVVRVAKLLLGKDAPALPASAGTPVERLRDHSTPPKVGLACPAGAHYCSRVL